MVEKYFSWIEVNRYHIDDIKAEKKQTQIDTNC